jgi:hypothetical protein
METRQTQRTIRTTAFNIVPIAGILLDFALEEFSFCLQVLQAHRADESRAGANLCFKNTNVEGKVIMAKTKRMK